MAVEVITTVLIPATATAPADPYDLTDLATVKDELQLDAADTSKDAFLQRAITQVSQAIRKYCNRTFQVEAIRDVIYIQQDPYPWQNPAGVFPLQLSRWPLVDYTPQKFVGDTHGTTTVDGIASTAGLVAAQLAFSDDGSLPDGTAIQTVSANSLLLTRAATSSVTALGMLSQLKVRQLLSETLNQTLDFGVGFTIDQEKGWLIRLDSFTGIAVKWEAVPTTVMYRAGFATIPPDLVDAVLRMVTGRFLQRGRDPMVVERTQATVIGTERFWVGSVPGQKGQFPPEIQGIVDNYRVPVTA